MLWYDQEGLPVLDWDGAHPRTLAPWLPTADVELLQMRIPLVLMQLLQQQEHELRTTDCAIAGMWSIAELNMQRLAAANVDLRMEEALATRDPDMRQWMELPVRLTRGMADVAQQQRRVEWSRWSRLHRTVLDLWSRLVARRRARRALYDNLVRVRRLTGQFDVYSVAI